MLTAKKIKSLIDTLTTEDKYKVIVCNEKEDEDILMSYTSLIKAAQCANSRVLIVLDNKESINTISDMILNYAKECDINIRQYRKYTPYSIEILLSNNSIVYIRHLSSTIKGLCIDHAYIKVADKINNIIEDIETATIYNSKSTLCLYMTPNIDINNVLISRFRKLIIE